MTTQPDCVSFDARLERHHPGLPIYLMVPGAVAEGFDRQRTFVVDVVADGRPIGRRSIKPWGDGRCFMELTKAHCQRLAITVGDRIALQVSLAAAVPPELEAKLDALGLRDRWTQRTEARRRAVAEHIFDAKTAATRRQRVERALAALRAHD